MKLSSRHGAKKVLLGSFTIPSFTSKRAAHGVYYSRASSAREVARLRARSRTL